MDRTTFTKSFTKGNTPQWQCPLCKKGELQVINDSFKIEETTKSEIERREEYWTPDDIIYVYSCLLECNNKSCKEKVTNLGTGGVDFDISTDEDGHTFEISLNYFVPKYFFPIINIFNYPDLTPKNISKELDASFELFFCNQKSSLNHLRISLEEILNFLKIKKYGIRKSREKNRRFFLNLHKRIDLIPSKYSNMKNLFLAIKWLGNSGSHSHETVSKNDVLDAYDIMEEILKILFDKKSDQIQNLAKKINKKKGPKR